MPIFQKKGNFIIPKYFQNFSLSLNGLIDQERKPKMPPEIKKTMNTRKEYATADSESNPTSENKKIKIASRVPRPDIDIGIKLTRFEIAIISVISSKLIDKSIANKIK